MEAFDVIKKRRSIREYKDTPIQKEILQKLVDAARFAPTARGVEPWEFIIINQADALKKIGEVALNGRFIANAKSCIAVFCQETKYYLEDGCAATENILLAATALGIGSCWVAGDKKPYCEQIGALLNVPKNFKLVSLIALGYPLSEGSLKIKEKRSLNELMHWEKF